MEVAESIGHFVASRPGRPALDVPGSVTEAGSKPAERARRSITRSSSSPSMLLPLQLAVANPATAPQG